MWTLWLTVVLLIQDFPGIRIGPEPTTDRFIAVMHGDTEGVIPGNALVVDPKKQFRPLSKFGNAFLNRFQCSTVNSPVLKGISIVDSPGILSGEKQRVDRGYEFTGVLEWFAERVDRIILLFDAHKLDISDEFRRSIEALRGHDDKIRIILNKVTKFCLTTILSYWHWICYIEFKGWYDWPSTINESLWCFDVVTWQSIEYSWNSPCLHWIFLGPTPAFWYEPKVNHQFKQYFTLNDLSSNWNLYFKNRLFEAEEQDLFQDLQSLPRNAALRKLNDLIKRARLAKVKRIKLMEHQNKFWLIVSIASLRSTRISSAPCVKTSRPCLAKMPRRRSSLKIWAKFTNRFSVSIKYHPVTSLTSNACRYVNTSFLERLPFAWPFSKICFKINLENQFASFFFNAPCNTWNELKWISLVFRNNWCTTILRNLIRSNRDFWKLLIGC